MSLVLQVPEPLAEELRRYCQTHAQTEAEVVQQALTHFLNPQPTSPTAYELWRRVFTPEGSGQPDLGSQAKEHLKRKLRERHSG